MALETGGTSLGDLIPSILRPLGAFLLVAIAYKRLVGGITRTVLLPSSAIGRNKNHLDACMRQAAVPIHKRVLINGRLDALLLVPKQKSSKNNKQATVESAKPKGWLIYSNANGVCYEHILRYTKFLGEFLNRKVCVFNYRGVGYSTGTCQSAQDMVEDLADVIEYLHAEHLDEDGKDDFVLWGHSIGGAVSLLTAHYVKSGKRRDTPFKIVADRSFSDLEVVVEDKLNEGPMAPMIAGFLTSSFGLALTFASLLGFGTHILPSLPDPISGSSTVQALDFARAVVSGFACMWVSLRLNPESGGRAVNVPFLFGFTCQVLAGDMWLSGYELDSLPAFVFASFAIAFELGSRGHFSWILRRIVSSQGWVMNPGAIVHDLAQSNHKVIVTYHREDEMIPMRAGLAEGGAVDPKHVLELKGPALSMGGMQQPQANHMYELDLFELKRIKDLLDGDAGKPVVEEEEDDNDD